VCDERASGRRERFESSSNNIQLTLGPWLGQRDSLQMEGTQVGPQNIARQNAYAQIGRNHPAHAFKAGNANPLPDWFT